MCNAIQQWQIKPIIIIIFITINSYVFLECACDKWPDLLEVLFTILWEESGEGALLGERMGHVSRLELLNLPVVHCLIIPR